MTAPDPRSGVQPDGSWQPAHEGQRPPFQPGNQVAVGNEATVKHGAWSPRRVDPLAEEIRAAVLADPEVAYLRAPRWAPAVWAWAQAEAQHQLVSEYLATRAKEAGDGVGNLKDERVVSAYLLQHRVRAHADRLRSQLGLTPVSWARLMKDGSVARAASVSAASVMAELHRLEQAGVSIEPPAEGPAEGGGAQ